MNSAASSPSQLKRKEPAHRPLLTEHGGRQGSPVPASDPGSVRHLQSVKESGRQKNPVRTRTARLEGSSDSPRRRGGPQGKPARGPRGLPGSAVLPRLASGTGRPHRRCPPPQPRSPAAPGRAPPESHPRRGSGASLHTPRTLTQGRRRDDGALGTDGHVVLRGGSQRPSGYCSPMRATSEPCHDAGRRHPHPRENPDATLSLESAGAIHGAAASRAASGPPVRNH